MLWDGCYSYFSIKAHFTDVKCPFNLGMRECPCKQHLVFRCLMAILSFVLFTFCTLITLRMASASVSLRQKHPTNMLQDPASLRFNSDGSFKIIQFADLHYGESIESDSASTKVMFDVIDAEQDTNLVVFTGDQVSGYVVNDIKGIFASWIDSLIPTAHHNLPFATVFGNHDDQPYDFGPVEWVKWVSYVLAGTSAMLLVMSLSPICIKRFIWIPLMCLIALLWIFYQVYPSSRVRRSLLRNEKINFPLLSRTDEGPWSMSGVSNYYLPVFYRDRQTMLLFFLDSGGGRLPEKITDDQINWAKTVSSTFQGCHSVAFMHIPPSEYDSVDKFECNGMNEEEKPAVLHGDAVSPIEDLASVGVKAVFAGHNHGNSWCCVPYQVEIQSMPSLCYGKHSGYGGYGNWTRGARVIKFYFNESQFSISTWLRMENGSVESRDFLFPYRSTVSNQSHNHGIGIFEPSTD